LEHYKEQGYSLPVQGLTLEEADLAYNRFFEVIGQSKYSPGPTKTKMAAWHHKYAWAYDLATHPSIIEPISQILGRDVVLWAMHFWYKEPGNEKSVPWHQDIKYWPMEPAINATAWVNLGYSIQENGCLKLIPGTHQGMKEHVAVDDKKKSFLPNQIPKQYIDESKAIPMEMTPGQITFFNEAIVHGSDRNTSNIPRVAFSLRFTTPEVKFKMEQWGGSKERIRTYLVSGEDRYHYNDDIAGVVPTR
jgi:ectoine hydroxylase-related dioxygenase (phytanoyl-CoA dioxygenase family)